MSDLEIRPATPDDLPAIVAMLADDPLGAQRESPDAHRFYERLGFEASHVGFKLSI
ncbi:hypothetical protein J7E96_18710 [Streptomyces sp. ISL-96]|nr:hypothetical protein [Streptomyces sp. ISL-96]MBT2490509.1 hypothetical protein [Streptomyces sp. ISL-96]